jgi:hypothetical protein
MENTENTENAERTFNVVGTSMLERQRKLRFASGSARTRANILKRHNHREVQLIELPKPMTKAEAIAWLQNKVGIKPAADVADIDLKQIATGLKEVMKSLPPQQAPKRGRPVKETTA